jgi:GDP-L-fucose synthase
MEESFKNKKIAILGSTGFFGKNLRQELIDDGYEKVYDEVGSSMFNFIRQDETRDFYKGNKFDVVINCLGLVGGIGMNQDHPAEMIYKNLQMNLNAIHYAYTNGVQKFIQIGTVCSYPKFTDIPFKEEYLWHGFKEMTCSNVDGTEVWSLSSAYNSNYPEETNAPYGLAKRILLPLIQTYKKQYNWNGVYIIPTNLYGPGDHFNTTTSHVIPALIMKIIEAKENEVDKVICWGTGNASRDFLYIKDACKGIVSALEIYNKPSPINLGSGKEVKIKEIVNIITKKIGYEGEIIWDESKPDGQPRRQLDITRAQKELGFFPTISINDGIDQTIKWFLKNRSL